MDINLRKANAIQQEIRSAMNASREPVSIAVTEFEGGEAAIAKAKAAYAAGAEKYEGLVSALYEIRAKVGAANEACGLNLTLTRIAEINELTSHLNKVTSASALRLDEPILEGKLSKMKEKPREGSGFYGHGDESVSTGIFDEADVKTTKARVDGLKREKRDFQDKILALNVENKITLSEAAVAVLKEEGII